MLKKALILCLTVLLYALIYPLPRTTGRSAGGGRLSVASAAERPGERGASGKGSSGWSDYDRFGGPGGGPRPPIAPEINSVLPDSKLYVPLIFPVLGSVHWHNDYNDKRGAIRHNGIDIPAPKMRPIVAPFSGIIGF